MEAGLLWSMCKLHITFDRGPFEDIQGHSLYLFENQLATQNFLLQHTQTNIWDFDVYLQCLRTIVGVRDIRMIRCTIESPLRGISNDTEVP